jgi:uncharacterized protein YndB with AHSA1/START domain
MRDRIEKTALLRTSLNRVWRAMSDSKEFGAWFGVRFEAPFSPGAALRGVNLPTIVNAEIAAAQKPYEGTAFDKTIEQIEPERLFSFRWHPFAIEPGVDYSSEPTTLVVFTLEQVADGVILTVTGSGFDQVPIQRRAKAFTANEQGWGFVMKLIEAYLVNAGSQ